MPFQPLYTKDVNKFLLQADAIILDHRDSRNYTAEHLPAAQLVSDAALMHTMRQDKNIPILIYCYHGNSSKDLASLLSNYGFNNVFNLEGGWTEWKKYQTNQKQLTSRELELWLLQQGFSPENKEICIANGMTPLMQAALLAETTYVHELLNYGVNINILNDDKNNALWFACVSEDLEIINMFISNDIDLNNRNVNGTSSLIYAASAGKFQVVKTLVEAGANISDTTLDGFNALDSASTIEILKYLKLLYKAA